MVTSRAALQDLVAVDLTTGLAGAYAGKLLCDLGARVVMVEPPGGSPLRARPPLGPDQSSAMFAHLSGGKESVIPPDTDADRVLEGLVWSADVVFVDGTSPWQPRLPAPRPEHVVEVDLSPWGRTGPYAAWRGSDIAVWAMGGYLYFTGTPDRQPLYLPGGQAELHAGAHAAFAALTGVHERRRSKLGQRVEVSHLESVLTAHAWLVSTWVANGMLLPRLPSDLIRASDGWFYSMRIVPWPDLFVMIERPDLGEEGLTEDLQVWSANIPRIFEAVAEWAKDKPVEEIIELAQALRLAMTPVLDTKRVAEDPQMSARSWWERADGDAMNFPGQPFHLSASPSLRRGS
ncbi:MAG: CoA transferase, partial [Acidimicrobiaceae bacterium]|nr:CoA transferase [Acidimicrobiaceae bacterium]